MKKICFIVPYFGILPNYFNVWLKSCENNPTIMWKVFTDDKRQFCCPDNVEIVTVTFSEVKKLISTNYNFEISLENPYKLVDYKIAYGEIFRKFLTDYDFWGYCDIDVIWGDIRSFYNEKILNSYSKIGCQGHCTIYKNSVVNNSIYRDNIDGDINYTDIFTNNRIFASDTDFIEKRFERRGIASYIDTIYAGLHIVEPGFYLQNMPKEEGKFNKYQLFSLIDKKLYRHYVYNDCLVTKEFLYIHFFKRPMDNLIDNFDKPIIIYPDVYRNFDGNISVDLVKKYGKKSLISFYVRVIKQNWRNIKLHKIISFVKNRVFPSYK